MKVCQSARLVRLRINIIATAFDAYLFVHRLRCQFIGNYDALRRQSIDIHICEAFWAHYHNLCSYQEEMCIFNQGWN